MTIVVVNPYVISGDRFSSNVVLLIGGDPGLSSIDESINTKTVALLGSAATTTADKKYGSGSLFVNEVSNYAELVSNSSLNLTADYTIEFWLKTGTQSNSYPSLLASAASVWGAGAVSIHISHAASRGKLSLYANGNESPIVTSVSTVTNSTWNFFAICRIGLTTRLWVNGQLESTNTSRVDALSFATNATRIGRDQWNGASGGLNNAYIDELRITTLARPEYTGLTSTVPSAPFPRPK